MGKRGRRASLFRESRLVSNTGGCRAPGPRGVFRPGRTFAPTGGRLDFIDHVVWVLTVFAGAGPMLYSGPQEILIDCTILGLIKMTTTVDGLLSYSLSREHRVDLMVVMLAGNLRWAKNCGETSVAPSQSQTSLRSL